MKITRSNDVSNLDPGSDNFGRFVSQLLTSITSVINGELDFTDNIKCSIVQATFVVVDTDVGITHTLGRTPVGYFVIGALAATNIYDGLQPKTDQLIYLRSSVVTTVRLLVF